jgi:hypothetical protein
VAGLPAEQEVALVAALPALENLSESLRTAAQRSRSQQSRYEQELAGPATRAAREQHRRPASAGLG